MQYDRTLIAERVSNLDREIITKNKFIRPIIFPSIIRLFFVILFFVIIMLILAT